MHWQGYIVSDPEILVGKPTVKGTRLSVDFLLGLLAEGWSADQLLENYPALTSESLQAVFSYAQDCLRDGLLFPEMNRIAQP